ncbi:MAG: ribonucleotide-diphosphate reductase subunit beta, partial [Chitinophagaceae bacterium]
EMYNMWLEHEKAHWLFLEVPLYEDIKDWNDKLNDHERNLLTHVFRFFVQGDVDVAGAYVKNYLPVFPQPEVRMMLCGFAAREAIHIAAYSYLIETLGMPEAVYNEFLEYQAMKDKHEYMNKMMSKKESEVAKQIATFSAFTEGMQLFSSFVLLLNFPRHGKMKGMGQIITWSIIDETMHCEAMIKLFRIYIQENRDLWKDELKSELYNIAKKSVELEDKFIDLAFEDGGLENLTIDEAKKYIRYVADRRLITMGLKGIYKIKTNPLDWLDQLINSPIHGNFFENRVTSYSKGALSGSWGDVWAK